MKLTSLEFLHRSMLALRPPADMQHFRVKMGAIEFDCLFSTRGSAYSLALTVRGEKPEFFLFPVSHQYEVSDSMDAATYWRMADILRTNGQSRNQLIPKRFFADIDVRIPTKASSTHIPSPSRIVELRGDIQEERDKPYFSHWRNPGTRKDGHLAAVSEKNRLKTLELLGREALRHSDINKLSSCWSPVFVKEGWVPN